MTAYDSSQSALDLLNTLARTLARGNATGGAPIIVSSTDVIRGEDLAAGQILVLRGGNSASGGNPGGDARLEGGQGDIGANGGNTTVRPGLPGVGGLPGIVVITNNGGDDDAPVMRWSSEGTNAGTINVFVGDRDPTGVIAALAAGDLYVRTNGTMFQASATGTGSWSQLGTGGGAPLQTQSFLDNTTQDLNVGTLSTDGTITVELNLHRSTGENTTYRITISASATDVRDDILQIDSNLPLTTVDVSTLQSAGNILVRLTGSGGGVNVDAKYRVLNTTPR